MPYYRQQRQGFNKGGPTKGAENPGAGKVPSGEWKTANYVRPDGATQPTDRSLGMERVKTRMAQKGV